MRTNAWAEIAIDLLDLYGDGGSGIPVLTSRRIFRLASIALSYVDAEDHKDRIFIEIASEIAEQYPKLAVSLLRTVLGTATEDDRNVTFGQLTSACEDARIVRDVFTKRGDQ